MWAGGQRRRIAFWIKENCQLPGNVIIRLVAKSEPRQKAMLKSPNYVVIFLLRP